MTDERYRQWQDAIGKARAAGDEGTLAKLQLDYNLELGSCLAHQSERTKEIKRDVVSVRDDVTRVGETVRELVGRMAAMEDSLVRTSESVASLATSVHDFVEYGKQRDSIRDEAHRGGFSGIRCFLISAAITWVVYASYLALTFIFSN